MNGGIARVYLSSKVVVDGAAQDTEGYYVFVRILGKPNNGSGCDCKPKDCPPSIILYPNEVVHTLPSLANCVKNRELTNFLSECMVDSP